MNLSTLMYLMVVFLDVDIDIDINIFVTISRVTVRESWFLKAHPQSSQITKIDDFAV